MRTCQKSTCLKMCKSTTNEIQSMIKVHCLTMCWIKKTHLFTRSKAILMITSANHSCQVPKAMFPRSSKGRLSEPMLARVMQPETPAWSITCKRSSLWRVKRKRKRRLILADLKSKLKNQKSWPRLRRRNSKRKTLSKRKKQPNLLHLRKLRQTPAGTKTVRTHSVE